MNKLGLFVFLIFVISVKCFPNDILYDYEEEPFWSRNSAGNYYDQLAQTARAVTTLPGGPYDVHPQYFLDKEKDFMLHTGATKSEVREFFELLKPIYLRQGPVLNDKFPRMMKHFCQNSVLIKKPRLTYSRNYGI